MKPDDEERIWFDLLYGDGTGTPQGLLNIESQPAKPTGCLATDAGREFVRLSKEARRKQRKKKP